MVHGNGQCLMGFLGDGTIRHGTGLKPLYNAFYTLYLLDIYALFRIIEIHQAAEVTGILTVNHLGVFHEFIIIPFSCGHLKHMDGLWVISVLLSLRTHFVTSHGDEGHICCKSQRVKSLRMLFIRDGCNILQGNATDS